MVKMLHTVEGNEMKEVTFVGCGHTETVDDEVKTYPGNTVMSICSRCLAVKSSSDLFVGYPCGYLTRYGRRILATVKEIRENDVMVATSQSQPGQLTYEEWIVPKSEFRMKGAIFTADPFGTVK